MIREEKQILRMRMKATLAALAEKPGASAKIRARLAASRLWREARVIYGFAPIESEPIWLDPAEAGEKVLAYPGLEGGVMRFWVGGELRPGVHGVWEPQGGEPAPPPDLVLVPGLAFTAEGFRMGRGGGHYDRWLEANRGVPSLGLCFACQLVKQMPTEAHDARVDAVLTD